MNRNWNVICAQAGSLKHEEPEDQVRALTGEVTVTALADGVGSLSNARQGAALAAQYACEEIAAHFEEYYEGSRTSRHLSETLQGSFMQKSGSDEAFRQMASTLLFAAVRDNRFLCGRIGDGAVLVFGRQSGILLPPQDTGLGGSTTYTILDADAGELLELKKGELSGIDGFLLTSDGMERSLYYPDSLSLPTLAYRLFGEALSHPDSTREELEREFTEYLENYFSKASPYADDCSLGILYRQAPSLGSAYQKAEGLEEDQCWPCPSCGAWTPMDRLECSGCRVRYRDLYGKFEIPDKRTFFHELKLWLHSGKGPIKTRPLPSVPSENEEWKQLARDLNKLLKRRNKT